MNNEDRIEILKKKREQINKVSCSFCTAKWLQTTLYLQNGYNHSCHHPAPHKIPLSEILEDPAALHNSKFKKEQRIKMLLGERPSECDYCWKIEDLDKEYFSDRHYKTSDVWAWDRFDKIATSNPNDNVYPAYLEISFSNACNFACTYCSPDISSKWMEDIKQHGEYPVENGSHSLDWLEQSGRMPYTNSEENPYVSAFWKWFPETLPYLKVLRLTGGEPTMSKDVWKVLDYIIANPNTDLNIAINTNLGVPDKLINNLIEKTNTLIKLGVTVDIYTSLESTGTQAEYARDGLNYIKWLENANKVLSQTSANLSIMTTINILSLPTFSTFINVIMDLRKTHNTSVAHNRVPLSINYLRWPPHLQTLLLDTPSRIAYADEIEIASKSWLKYNSTDLYARLYLEEWDQIQRFCNYLRTSSPLLEYRHDFVKYINAFDKRRNKDFKSIFPEFALILETW